MTTTLPQLEPEFSRSSKVHALGVHLLCELKIFWSTPATVIFIIAMPVVLYAVFGFAFRSNSTQLISFDGIQLSVANRSYAGVLTFALMSVGFANVGIGLAIRRTAGVYRRLQTSAASPWVVIGAYLLSIAVMAVLVALIVTAMGVVLFGVTISPSAIPGLIGGALLALATFAALGTAVSLLPRTVELAVPLINAIFFPVAFLSGVFFDIPLGDTGDAIITLLPVRSLVNIFASTLGQDVAPIAATDVLTPAAWFVAGLLLSAWRFRWTAEVDLHSRLRIPRGKTQSS